MDRPSNIADHSSVDSAMRLPRFSDSPLPRYSHLFPGGSEVFAERIRKEENERVALEKELGQEIGIL